MRDEKWPRTQPVIEKHLISGGISQVHHHQQLQHPAELTDNRSFLVANAQPESCHIIFCSDGFCKMTGFTRAEVMQRSACTEFLQGQMTSQAVVQSIKEALRKGEEQHFEILYYRKNVSKPN
ncbi:conserved hypothetical protein [Culex quinquefasciatus]|uniref:PAS domain-containing protein n=1 Tax=Culex quinquefasciatus TaxID=7176 RepID=B0WVU7_CULQU|nr:conserved hypothetical protein [Culex quinquefasciatus]|eukprot:XP_001861519.1 conserved hypothetical protein [Culex quinquefasciatus]